VEPDGERGAVREGGMAVVAAAGGLVLWFLWQSVLLAGLRMEPGAAVAWAGAVTVFFLWMHGAPVRWNRRLRVQSRLRWPPRGLGWTAALAPGLLLLLLGATVSLLALGLATPDEFPPLLEDFAARPGGVAALVVIAVTAIPVVEEVGFRGWVQRPLERGIGPQAAIALTTAVFAAVHLGSSLLPARLAGGLVLGHAVYATRSTWTGILLHAAWNGGMFALDALLPAWDPSGAGWRWAGPAAVAALAALLWCVWAVRRLEGASGGGG
jgi:membrane protease YdiL (CAAX protease family)